MSQDFDIDDLDTLEVSEQSTWSAKKQFHYEHLRQITDRIVSSKIDLTGNLQKPEFTTIGFMAGIFGDLGFDFFDSICRNAKDYTPGTVKEKFEWCKNNTKLKSLAKLIDICKENNISTTFNNETQMAITVADFMDDEATAEQKADAMNFGIYEKNNCYYSIELRMVEGSGYSKQENQISNFAMRIRYMIKSRKRPLRVIEIKQTNFTTGATYIETVEVDTDKISTKSKFDAFVQGIGPYKFYGTDKHFTKLQLKYFSEEKAAEVIEVLGQNKNNLYFFNNGLIHGNKFTPAESDGIVTLDGKIFYIPSGNEANQHDDLDNINERKFIYQPGTITFKQWSELFYQVYSKPGMVGMAYGCSCLFSDIIFNYCKGYVMPMFYGAPSAGKGRQIKSIQHLWGTPQDPLNIPSKANTDKGKIRKLAQFKNALLLLEEIPENPSEDIIEFLKNLWDRYGYTKAERDHSYKTSQTPVNSGVMITSNYYPKWNDPLLTRLLVIEFIKNQFSDEERTLMEQLEKVELSGITTVTLEILQHREAFKNKFPYTFSECVKDISAPMRKANIKEDRMIKNVAMILATYKILENVLQWPFTYEEIKSYMIESMALQQSKRSGNSKASMWWTIFLKNIKDRKIKHGINFDIKGDIISIVWMECYNEYMEAIRKSYNQIGAGKEQLKNELEASEIYKGFINSYRFSSSINNKKRQTSVLQFDLNLLKSNDYDVAGAVEATQLDLVSFGGSETETQEDQEQSAPPAYRPLKPLTKKGKEDNTDQDTPF